METIRISNEELAPVSVGKTPSFPKYTSFVINQANRTAQATRPKIVGKMSELAKEFRKESKDHAYPAWVNWYLKKHPKAIVNATEKVCDMLERFEGAMEKIDENLVRTWVADLVITKTYVGLVILQEAILKKIAEKKGKKYRLANPEEESKGIDGYIGNQPVSVKPITYKTKDANAEEIGVPVVFYEKKKEGLVIQYDF